MNSAPPSADKEKVFLERNSANFFQVSSEDFRKIPGSPIAYSASDNMRVAFSNPSLKEITVSEGQNKTADNDKYVRLGWEVRSQDIGRNQKWLTYAKGGDYRKWFGNLECVIDWSQTARQHYRQSSSCRIIPEYLWFEPGITWTLITWDQSFRYLPVDATFDMTGSSVFLKDPEQINSVLGFLNSKVSKCLTALMNPTLALQIKNVRDLPVAFLPGQTAVNIVGRCLELSKLDYCSSEKSVEYRKFPLLCEESLSYPTIESSYTAWITQNRDTIAEMKRLEEENNRLFIDAYGLGEELTPDVPIAQITLTVNPAYRYGDKLTIDEQWTRFRQDTMEELVSYAIGCMMGRYSLDAPGLIYAHSGNEDFDPSQYTTFPADDDGIIPLTDTDWFADDAVHRLVEFISVAWDESHLEDNLEFLADNLAPKLGESSRDTIRRYLCDSFFKNHLQSYKKRPIYWLFSSGKQKAFQCLVYLHRYNEGTLARMRTEYVIPLSTKLNSYAERLEQDRDASTSAAETKRLEKQLSTLHKQQTELAEFDEKLRHYADQRISLDLDDGVKVNYGKFGDLLAEVKAVIGEKQQ
ncbi:MAG: BREX-1 system adenine-specific DNA-methyltransferase PglX [Haliea sp.]